MELARLEFLRFYRDTLKEQLRNIEEEISKIGGSSNSMLKAFGFEAMCEVVEVEAVKEVFEKVHNTLLSYKGFSASFAEGRIFYNPEGQNSGKFMVSVRKDAINIYARPEFKLSEVLSVEMKNSIQLSPSKSNRWERITITTEEQFDEVAKAFSKILEPEN